MSADAWWECPCCHGKIKHPELEESYGKIPLEEFEKLKAKFEEEDGSEPHSGHSVRVYEDIYLDNDCKLHINIGCTCEMCGAEWDFDTVVDRKDYKVPKL